MDLNVFVSAGPAPLLKSDGWHLCRFVATNEMRRSRVPRLITDSVCKSHDSELYIHLGYLFALSCVAMPAPILDEQKRERATAAMQTPEVYIYPAKLEGKKSCGDQRIRLCPYSEHETPGSAC